MESIKELFLLDPKIHFLNHGSFGACPRPVFQVYQDWQLELERQPVEFLGRRATDLQAEARNSLAHFLGIQNNEVVYFPNPTTAINMVARNLDKLIEGFFGKPIQDGDHILTTNHEYGALVRTWKFVSQKFGLHYNELNIPLPITSQDVFIERIWSQVGERTKLIFISHITSPTALIFPVAQLCDRARQAGILTIVDGAHAPGQIPLDLNQIGADIYTGACHKWLCAPKGSAFLYVREALQPYLDPLVVSWGYQPDEGFGSGDQFIDYHEWQGTRDLAATLSVPAAIKFQEDYDWEFVQDHCHAQALKIRQSLTEITGIPGICPDDSKWFRQMFSVPLPDKIDAQDLQVRLYTEFNVEVPIVQWQGHNLLRVSIQGYNTQEDIEALIRALRECL